MEGLEGGGLLPHPQEFDRLTGNGADGQGGAAAGVAIGLGQHHTGERQGRVEGTRGIGGILAGHTVHHEQGLDRIHGSVQALDLLHHVGVDVQAPGGIDDQHIHVLPAGRIECRLGNGERILVGLAGKEGHVHFAGQGAQLLDGRRAIHIATGDHDRFLAPLLEPACQLRRTGGLARALQAGHQHHRRWLYIELQFVVGLAHDVHQLIMNHFHQGLARGQALQHLMTDRPLPHPFDEFLHHRQGDIRLQQRHAHFPQGVLDIVFAQPPLPTQVLEGAAQPFREIFEHGRSSLLSNDGRQAPGKADYSWKRHPPDSRRRGKPSIISAHSLRICASMPGLR